MPKKCTSTNEPMHLITAFKFMLAYYRECSSTQTPTDTDTLVTGILVEENYEYQRFSIQGVVLGSW